MFKRSLYIDFFGKRWKLFGWSAGFSGSTLAMVLLMGVSWGCGSDQPLAPTATTSMSRSHSPQSAYQNGGGGPSDTSAQSDEYAEQANRLATYQQQLRDADSDTTQDVLVNGIYSDNPAIKVTALNGLASMLSWNAQARADVERVLQFESDPGMRTYIEDLLAKESSHELLQATSAGAAQN